METSHLMRVNEWNRQWSSQSLEHLVVIVSVSKFLEDKLDCSTENTHLQISENDKSSSDSQAFSLEALLSNFFSFTLFLYKVGTTAKYLIDCFSSLVNIQWPAPQAQT
jgi:hypothetical protein